jgi:maleate isomerase
MQKLIIEPLRCTIACIQLPTDHTGDLDIAGIVSLFPRVALRLQKMDADEFEGCDETSYSHLKGSIQTTLKALKPNHSITAAALACTSMSFSIGLEETNKIIQNCLPLAKPTSMGHAITTALKSFDAKKLVVITPYINEVAQMSVNRLEEQGFDVLGYDYLGLHQDLEIENIDPKFIFEKAVVLANKFDEADAIVLCCSAMRTTNIIDKLEKEVGKPVIASTQAMVWHLLRLSGIDDKINKLGRLFLEF